MRVKGGAAANQLYDLQNGYITNAGSIVPREGTIRAATLDSSTVGLAAANGKFNIFSSSFSTATLPAGYVLNVLSDPNDRSQPVVKIWFAKPFMGFEFVVAEFGNGDIAHFWLQSSGVYTSSTDYTSGSIVLPIVPNGLAYQAVRDFPAEPLWTPDTVITSGSYVEPNTPTGFAYQAVATTGSPVHTGAIEPTWPTTAGAIIQEFGDFDASSATAGNSTLSTAAALGSTITDRYGDSSTVSNAGIFNATSTLSTLTLAQTKITTWKGGTNYAPGAVVTPTTTQGAFINAIPNGDFEGGSGAGGWTFTDAGGTTNWGYSSTLPYQGTECIAFANGAAPGPDGAYATMTSYSIVTPGQSVTANAYLDPNNSGAALELWLQINWYDSTDTFLSFARSAPQEGGGYRSVSVTGVAPATAAHARVAIRAGSGTSSRNQGFADLVSWNLATPAPITNFLFEAVQPTAASSAATEPTWPTVLGNEVIDGGVTWKAIGTSIITWQAIPLMESGLGVPTFPTTIGNTVFDYSTFSNINGYVTTFTGMSWMAVDRSVSDIKDPNTKAVAIGASHVFAGDNDIVDYSAAVNPLDWTSTNNAGYLPTGLNNYGDNPVTALALYRGNLIVFNTGGYQMWQIDPDPQNMAFLDAQTVGSIYPRGAQSVANDLLFLTEIGVRNLGTIGATANMAIGNTGQQVDPLVLAQIKAATYDPFSTYYPGRGQYWLIWGPQVFVLTINGLSGTKSWARYIFPDIITDATLNGGFLYLRTAGNLVWQLNSDTLADDYQASGGSSSPVVLLLPFNGTAGSQVTTDISYLANPVQVNILSPTSTIQTATPHFAADSYFDVQAVNTLGTYVLRVPLTYGSALDIFTGVAWTIEAFVRCNGPTESFPFPWCGYAASTGGGAYGGFTCDLTDDGVGNVTLSIDGSGAFGGGGLSTAQTFTGQTPGAWHHVAVSWDGTTGRAFFDGVQLATTVAHWNSGNYAPGPAAGNAYVVIGSNVQQSGLEQAGDVEQFRVSNVAQYVANFTPPTAPFNPATGITFDGVVQWPYLDMGTLGLDKMMVGVDLVGGGDCYIQLAYNQSDKSTFNDNANFATSTGVTAPYFVVVDDTVPGEPLPIPINAPSYSLILTFPGNVTTANAWSWQAANLYISPNGGAGATG